MRVVAKHPSHQSRG